MNSGPKTVTCSVCGETVSKRKTLLLKDGSRACRSHEGVEDQASQLWKEEQEKKDREARAREQEKSRYAPFEHPVEPCCWFCGKVGLRQDVFFTRMLVCGEKYQLKTGKTPNIFDMKEAQEVYREMNGKKCLWVVSVTDENRDKIKSTALRGMSMVVDLAGGVLICQACADKHKIEVHHPKLDPEKLTTMAAVYESGARQVIREVASKELEESGGV
jgi:hypothetical protein